MEDKRVIKWIEKLRKYGEERKYSYRYIEKPNKRILQYDFALPHLLVHKRHKKSVSKTEVRLEAVFDERFETIDITLFSEKMRMTDDEFQGGLIALKEQVEIPRMLILSETGDCFGFQVTYDEVEVKGGFNFIMDLLWTIVFIAEENLN